MSNAATFSVNHWGSHPDLNNDDCFTGEDFETLTLAEAALTHGSKDYSVRYLELDGPNVHRVVENPNYNARACKRDDSEWRNERAMQAGMAFGCDGYNDEMGY